MKKIIALFCAVALLLAAAPQPAVNAARMTNPNNRIEGIDYSRIEENEYLTMPVVFTIGEARFDKAELVNGHTLTPEEVDEVIRKVMASFDAVAPDGSKMPMTEGRLNFYADAIESARRIKGDYVKGFDSYSLVRLVGLALGFDISEGWSEVGSFAGSKLVDKLADVYLPTKLLNELVGIVDDGGLVMEVAGELFRMYVEHQEARDAVMYTALLDNFYLTCNEEIKKAERQKAQESWRIKCNQTVWRSTTLFGVPVKQYLKLTCDLTRDFDYGGGYNADWSGRYRGSIMVEIWHDLSLVDEQFKEKIFLSDSLPFDLSSRAFDYKDESTSSSRLVKLLINNDFELHLDRRNGVSGGMVQPFSLKGFRDISEFYLYRQMHGTPNLSVFDDEGNFHLEIEGGLITVDANVNVRDTFRGGLTGDSKGALIYATQWEFNDTTWAQVPAGNWSYTSDYSESGDIEAVIMTDYTPFDMLRYGGLIEIEYDVE
jgi:hypothetical protein